MMPDLPALLVLSATVGSALVGGIFFTFSNFVMGALRRLPPAAGAAAMQSINVRVMNPLFFTVFFGTGAVALAAAVVSTGPLAPLCAVGAGIYLVGCIGVTGVKNVPLNNTLAAGEPESAEGGDVWRHYLDRWTFWNHVRTAACLLAAALFSAAAI